MALIASEYSVSTGSAAAVVTAFALSYGLFQIVYGPLGDRFGRYPTVAVAAFVSAFASLGCALAPTLDALVLARWIAGATIGGFIPLSLAWIGDSFPYERRQTVLARFLVGQMSGMAFGTALAGWLAEHFGWRSIFVVLSGFLLAISVLIALELKRNPLTARPAGAPRSVMQSLKGMPRLFARPWVRMLVAMGCIEGMLVFGAFAFVAFDLQRRYGLGPGAAGTLLSAYAAGGFVYAFNAKRMVRRFGETGLAVLGGGSLALGYALLVVAPSPWVATLGLAAVGAGFYVLHTTLQTNVTHVAPEERGAAVALFATFLFMGQAAGVWLAGRVVDAVGTRPVFAAAALGLLALGLVFRRKLLGRGRHVA